MMLIVNRATFPVDVWLDGVFQGHAPAQASSFVPKEGFVTLDSGLRLDGTSQHQYSYGGWLSVGRVKVFLFAVLDDGTPKYWTGTVDVSRGPECFLYFDGPEPDDLSWRNENAVKLLPGTAHPDPASKGVRVDGTVTASEAGLIALGNLRRMVAPPSATPPPVDSLAALVGRTGGTPPAPAAPPVKLPVPGELQVAQPTFLVVTTPADRNSTTTQENARVRFRLLADEKRKPVLTVNGHEVAVTANPPEFSADVPLKTGANTFAVRVSCPKRGMVEEAFSIERKVPDNFQAKQGAPNQWIKSGGFGTTEVSIKPTPDASKRLALSFDLYQLPDRVKVYYKGSGGERMVYDSGTRSGAKDHLALPAYGGEDVRITVEGKDPTTEWMVKLEAN